jgi:type II secretory pathway component GspD/PulD (secretin)
MIVPDVRLNALIVHASPADLDLMEQLLTIIDRPDVPESTVNPRPRLIPVMNTGAAQIAEILREVYTERMAGARNQQQRQPSPEEFIQMLRGGGGGRGGSSGSRSRQAEVQKISIGVDARTNSLVVSASEPVFQEIEQLVKTLDHATTDSNQAIRVVTLKRSNPATVQKALTAIVGEKARTSDKPSDGSGSRGDGSSGSSGSTGGGPPVIMSPDSRQIQDMMRQRMEMFNQMRGGSGGGSPGGFGGSRTFGPGGTSGFGGGDRGGGDRGR